MIRNEEVYKIGQITKPHGLKGELSMNVDDDIFDRVDCPYLICDVDGLLVPFFIEEYRFKTGSTALIKFADIDSSEKAQILIGSTVYFENKYIEDGDEEEVSLNYFIGFTVKDGDKVLGPITDIDDQTENWLFVVEHKEDELLIPAQEDFIVDIDHKKRIITMNLPTGLVELNE